MVALLPNLVHADSALGSCIPRPGGCRFVNFCISFQGELPSQAPGMQSAALGVTAVGAAFIVGRKGKGKKSLGLKASTQDVLFKGGAGTVDGGMGAGSFGGSKSTSSTSATVSASDLGVQAPTGYWDPLGLNAKADAATFNRRRAVEIKHGRVAMYATIGYIVPEYYKFPGALARNMMDYDGSNIDVRCIQH